MSRLPDDELMRVGVARMARLLEDSPNSMSWVLARFRQTEGVDDAAIARQLQIEVHQLHHLALCGRPRPYLFSEDIESIAEHFGVDQSSLAAIVRHVEAIETFREYEVAADRGLVAAARDVAEDAPDYEAEDGVTGPPSNESDDKQ